MDELLAYFLLLYLSIPSLGMLCLFTFGTSAAVFLERAIQCIYQLILSSIASIVALFSFFYFRFILGQWRIYLRLLLQQPRILT